MPEYLSPGVYIEETERDSRFIDGVPTGTAAFLGETERGPIRPRLVTSFEEYQRWFGNVFAPDRFLPYAVDGFFKNGGRRVFICRLVGEGAGTALADFGEFSVSASGPGAWGRRIWAKIEDSTTRKKDGTSVGFRLRLAYWGGSAEPFDPFSNEGQQRYPRPTHIEDFDDLVVEEGSPDYYGRRIPFIDQDKGQATQGPETSALAVLVRKSGAAATARPANASRALSEGGAADANALEPDDYVGNPKGVRSSEQGLAALELDPYREAALVYAPDAHVSNDIALKIIEHCERLRSRFAVLDCAKGQVSVAALEPRTNIPTNSSYAAFYCPWIVVPDPLTGARKLIPPGGHVLGVYARIDAEPGVFKAPANEPLRGALDIEYDINDAAQDLLSPRGVNTIRQFEGRGIRVWGARTLASDELLKYVHMRRLIIFLERSICEGTQWVVFEPNDDRLWARVSDAIRLFLRTQWRLGALSGQTEQEAFFVTCDRTKMTQDDIRNGRLICEIGIAPVQPADFWVFRILWNTAEGQP